jgi:hypothetical protein
MHLTIQNLHLSLSLESARKTDWYYRTIVSQQTDPADKTWHSIIIQGLDLTETVWDNDDKASESSDQTTCNEVQDSR